MLCALARREKTPARSALQLGSFLCSFGGGPACSPCGEFLTCAQTSSCPLAPLLRSMRVSRRCCSHILFFVLAQCLHIPVQFVALSACSSLCQLSVALSSSSLCLRTLVSSICSYQCDNRRMDVCVLGSRCKTLKKMCHGSATIRHGSGAWVAGWQGACRD